MRPCREMSKAEAAGLHGVLFDLDDTLLDHGALSVRALAALYSLKRSGLRLVGVTGRPAAWGQVLIRQWPLDAMVTENGIIGFSKQLNRIIKHDRLTSEERTVRARRLANIVAEVRTAFPALQPTDDALGRIGDSTLDVGESVQIEPALIAAAERHAIACGARVITSSVHMHLSLDADDKASGALRLLSSVFGVDATRARFCYAFIGDSGNDAPCFAAFRTTVGVRNLCGQLTLTPRYQTQGARGEGFVEFAETLVTQRS